MRVCNVPGCPTLTDQGKCDECRALSRKASDRRRPNARQRGYDRKWERTRTSFLQLHPYCSATGCMEQATEAHHLDGKGPSGPRGHDWTNLEGLCKPHHSQRTATEQPGGWAA